MTFIRAKLHRGVERTLAAVLLIASIFKLESLFNGDPFGSGLTGLKPALGVLVVLELAMAMWMWTGGANSKRFYFAFGTFCLLASVAFLEVLRAVPKCGCFGKLPITPEITASFDAFAAFSLWLTHPRFDEVRFQWKLRQVIQLGLPVVLLASFYLCLTAISERAIAASPNYGLGGSEPASWINRPFPFFDKIEGASDLKRGKWIVI